MRDRKHVESLFNWQATFERADGKIVCLMRTINGGLYWDAPNYQGTFSWGATSSFDRRSFQDALARDRLRLLKGHLPDSSQRRMPCK